MYMFHNHMQKAEKVFKINDLEEVRLFGKQFQNRSRKWLDVESRRVLEELNYVKSQRCEKFHRTLMGSESHELRENTNNPVWGFADGTGCNIMGIILMELRDHLKLERMI